MFCLKQLNDFGVPTTSFCGRKNKSRFVIMKQLGQWRLKNVQVLPQCFLTIYWIHLTVAYLLIGTIYVESSFQRCQLGFETPGWTSPQGDIIVEVGNSLEIFCSLFDDYVYTKGFSSKNIVFYNGSTAVDRSLVALINETTAKLRIDDVNVSVSMFYCKLSYDQNNNSYLTNNIKKNQLSDSDEKPDTVVCLNHVQIGTKPMEVSNFTCISYNWEFLNVSWITPENSVRTEYTVFYQTPRRPGRGTTYQCPNNDDKLYGRCMWALHTDPAYRRTFDYLTFTINGSNRFGNTTQIFKIPHFAHILPNPPHDLKAINKTVSSIYLNWGVGPLHILEKGLFFKIEYTSSSIWTKLTYHSKDSKELYTKGDRFGVNVADLKYPNMPYNFRVYTKSAVANGEEFWSSPSHLIIKTKSCPPYSSPKTDVGSFEVIHETTVSRDVLIYWKALTEHEFNGDNFRYDITVFENDEITSIKPDQITNSYAKFANLNFNSYRFFIKSVNADGAAKYSSSVYLPEKSEIIPEPIVFTKIDYGDGIYQLSWKPPDISQDAITNFTTFWCESNKDRPYQCNGSVDWIHLPGDTTKHNFTINSTSSYQFAISVNSAESSSGMVWASCTALPDKLNKMKNVWIGKITSYSIEVKWRLVCSERIDSIKGYYVYYCATSDSDRLKCTEPEKSLKVYGDVTTMQVNVTSLKPFTNYKIQVAVFIKDDRVGPRSDEMVRRTLDGPPDAANMSVDAFEITDRSARLRWNRPSVTNGILQGYKVQYNDKEIEVNTTETTLTDLASYTNYHIRVSACTLFCSEMNPTTFSTKIGVPSAVGKPTMKEINSSHVLVEWNPPSVLAGPGPLYDVKVQFDQVDQNSTVDEFEVAETKAIIAVPNCANEAHKSSYTLYVRAKNVDQTDVTLPQYFIGDWSPAFSISCLRGGIPTLWKILLLTSLLVLIVSLMVFWAKKGFYKFQQMQDFDVTLPPKFINPPVFQGDMKQQNYHNYIGSWPDDLAECDRLHSISKITDIDQSSVDCIEIDMDTDRETDRSSSGCYTN